MLTNLCYLTFQKETVQCVESDTEDIGKALDGIRFTLVIELVILEKHNRACDPPIDYSKLIELLKKSGKSVFVSFVDLLVFKRSSVYDTNYERKQSNH